MYKYNPLSSLTQEVDGAHDKEVHPILIIIGSGWSSSQRDAPYYINN